MLDTTEPSVNSLLRRARAAFDTRLPATGRERALEITFLEPGADAYAFTFG
jgi:hypothetical protein